MDDEHFMALALRQARRGLGLTSPNPAVGAVIVRGGAVLSRGYHRRAGCPHAEIEALAALPAGRIARGATLYVTLEPCSTHGRTPPCVEAILRAGLRRVVIGTMDPNPKHAGRGVELLRAAGVEVAIGLREVACREINLAFNRWIVTRRPWVIAKAGLSLDGRLTRPPGEDRWLTGEAARADAHRLRALVDAIVIGANTLRADNPRLTIRRVHGFEGKPQPWRVVLTSGRRPLPKAAHLFTDAQRERTLVCRGQTLASVLRELGRERAVTSVLLEGGGQVLGEAFDSRLVDEVCFYLAPRLCGGPHAAVAGKGHRQSVQAPALREIEYRRFGNDLRLRGRI